MYAGQLRGGALGPRRDGVGRSCIRRATISAGLAVAPCPIPPCLAEPPQNSGTPIATTSPNLYRRVPSYRDYPAVTSDEDCRIAVPAGLKEVLHGTSRAID